jgi:hypothetical protein
LPKVLRRLMTKADMDRFIGIRGRLANATIRENIRRRIERYRDSYPKPTIVKNINIANHMNRMHNIWFDKKFNGPAKAAE